MAKKKTRKGPVSLKSVVRQLDSHIRKLQKAKKKKRATPKQKKQLSKHIGHLKRVRAMTTDGCEMFIMPVD